MIFAGCGAGDSTKPQTIDKAEATIGPTGGTLVTPSGAAGVQIPAGAVSQPVVVTVTSIATPQQIGSGPLPTNLRQYPPFYEFQTSPPNALFGDSVRVGVCQVTDPSSQFYVPEADHPRLKLAHTVGASIEILKRVDVSDFLRCTNVTASARSSGWKGALARIAGQAGNLIAASPAYAAHGGLGGKVKSFSPFGAVVDACADSTVIGVPSLLSGALESTDCLVQVDGGAVVEWYKLTLPAQTILFLTSTGINYAVAILATFGPFNPDNLVFDADAPRSDFAILPAGDYVVAVIGGANFGRREFTVNISSRAANPFGCPFSGAQNPRVFVYPGIVVGGTIATDDCIGSQPNVYVDHYEMQMVAGKRYQINAIGNGLALEIGMPNGSGGLTLLASNANASGSASVTFTAQISDIHIVNVLGFPAGKTGPYTLRITKLN